LYYSSFHNITNGRPNKNPEFNVHKGLVKTKLIEKYELYQSNQYGINLASRLNTENENVCQCT